MPLKLRNFWPTFFGCVFLFSAIMLFFILGTSEVEEDANHPPPEVVEKLKQIEHIIVIYQENRSFDFLFGNFPGAEGIPNKVPPQRQFSEDSDDPLGDGPVYKTLPKPHKQEFYLIGQNVPDQRFPEDLENVPYLLESFVPAYSSNLFSELTGNPVHRFYQCIGQINGGKMDKFVAWASRDWRQSQVNGLVMAYTDSSHSPFAKLASDYVLCDHFFQSMYGGSIPNHWVLIAGQPLYWKEGLQDPEMIASTSAIIRLNAQGFPASQQDDGWLNPEGWVVNNPQDSDHK